MAQTTSVFFDSATSFPVDSSKPLLQDSVLELGIDGELANETDETAMSFDNLLSLLESRSQTHSYKSLTFYSPGKLGSPPSLVSYGSFFQRVKRAAAQLLQEDIRPGSIVLIHFDNHYDNLLFFWAATYAGFVPAMSTPLSNNVDQRRAHLLHLWALLKDPLVLMHRRHFSEFSVQSVLRLRAVEDLPPPCSRDYVLKDGLFCPIKQGSFKKAEDLAALMLTSGSTGLSKAVCLTHRLILKSVSSKCSSNKTNHQTPFFSWIGADHVACLTEIHVHALWAGADQVFAEAVDIVADPLSFWKIINKHQIGYSFAPNFFLASLLRALTSPLGTELQKHTDVASLRAIVTGGEANVVDTCSALAKVLQAAGAPENCLKPAFGMTETNAGSIYNHAFPVHDVCQGYDFASVGKCIEGIEMRIIDENRSETPPGRGIAGMLEVRGALVFSSYFNDSEATEQSFHDGWFVTGDRGMIDTAGQLILTGRAKELLIINGVNYSPNAIETILEGIEGTSPSYTLVFPYRFKRADTESLCVVYLPTYQHGDAESREETNNAISRAVLLQVGVRPLIIPLNSTILQKSTLGKLPRNKIRKALEAGDLESLNHANQQQLAAYRASQYEAPSSQIEQLIIDTFLEVLNVPDLELGATTNLFAMGVNSVNLIMVKQKLKGRLNRTDIPMVTIISNPTARELATALELLGKIDREYDPLVMLQSAGTKAPLWLIHPGVGEVLVFLALTYYIRDRPLYAMRARGFEVDEPYFNSIDETVRTYLSRMKQIQPHGPYAIAGYSFGSMIAFEIAKILGETDEVRFLGAFNLPPHIKQRMRQLDWYNCLLHLSYFLGFFDERHAHLMHPVLQKGTREAALEYVLGVAPAERMAQLGLDANGFRNWVNLAYSLQSSAVDYEPSGSVDSMDIFCAVPLTDVARDMDDWIQNHLSKWSNFCSSPPRFHRVDGAHYTMLSSAHIHTFQKTLKKALEERGV